MCYQRFTPWKCRAMGKIVFKASFFFPLAKDRSLIRSGVVIMEQN